MTSTLTQYEYDRLEVCLQNSKHHWVPSPKGPKDPVKRPLQLAFEEVENLRGALRHVYAAEGQVKYLDRALRWMSKYPKSKRARKLSLIYLAASIHNVDVACRNAKNILGRKANVVRPDGTEEHA